MIKILHGADFHLDSAFSSLTPEQAAQRRQEQREVLKELAARCQGCDLVLLAGDLFDSAHIYRDTLDALKEFFASVSAEVFIAPGNHDFIVPGSPYLTENWGENVHIFTSGAIEKISIDRLNCDVYGAGFTAMGMPALLQDFRVENPERYNLMVLHGELSASSDYNPITAEQVATSGLSYLALGHVHSGAVQRFGGTLCAWPGCLMGRGFDECGEKGVLKVTLSREKQEAEFLPLATRKYEILQVEAGDDPIAAIENALPGDTARDCYRVELTGEAEQIDLLSLQERFRPRFFSLSLRDHTLPRQALWAAVQEDTLRGHFLRTLKAEYDSADTDRKQKILQAAKLVTALMDGREVPL